MPLAPTRAKRKNRRGRRPRLILLGQKHEIFDSGQRIEFAFAGMTGAELVGQFNDVQGPWRRGEDIDQDFRPDAGKLRRKRVDQFPPQHEEPADRIGHVGFQNPSCQLRAELAEPLAGVRRQAVRPRRPRHSGSRR